MIVRDSWRAFRIHADNCLQCAVIRDRCCTYPSRQVAENAWDECCDTGHPLFENYLKATADYRHPWTVAMHVVHKTLRLDEFRQQRLNKLIFDLPEAIRGALLAGINADPVAWAPKCGDLLAAPLPIGGGVAPRPTTQKSARRKPSERPAPRPRLVPTEGDDLPF